VSAELELSPPDGVSVAGTWRLDVSVENGDGWTRTTSTGTPTGVTGEAQTLRATLPIGDLLDLTNAVAGETGVPPSDVRMAVTAVLDLELVDGGRRTPATSTSVLSFTANPQRVDVEDGIELIQTSPVAVAGKSTTVVRLLGRELPASKLRALGTAAALPSVLLLGLLALGRRREQEDDRITRTSSALLVPAQPILDAQELVDVGSWAALLQVAQRYERMVLYADDGGLRYYFVLDDGIAYRYYSEDRAAVLDADRAAAASVEPGPDEDEPVAGPAPAGASPELPALPRQRDAAADLDVK
jgi:hypothetical protein